MCESGRRLVLLGLVMALAALVVGGCAPVAATSPPAASDSPATAGPTNFASPEDIMKRYPTMRRQQL